MDKNKGLGRLHKPDERDKRYLIRDILPKQIPITHKAWYANGWWGNQQDTPMCVGYSLAHWIEDGPVGHIGSAPIVHPDDIYYNAQKLDEWDGEDYEGTSVRGGAKYLKSIDFIKEYRWAFNLQDTIDTLLTVGPVVVGTNWYYGMFDPDRDYTVHLVGRVAGGHAYVLDAVNTNKKRFRIKNSWGRDWGHNGFAYIHFDDMERLLNEDGECMIAIENEI